MFIIQEQSSLEDSFPQPVAQDGIALAELEATGTVEDNKTDKVKRKKNKDIKKAPKVFLLVLNVFTYLLMFHYQDPLQF